MKIVFKILDIIAHVIVIFGVLIIGMGLSHLPVFSM